MLGYMLLKIAPIALEAKSLLLKAKKVISFDLLNTASGRHDE